MLIVLLVNNYVGIITFLVVNEPNYLVLSWLIVYVLWELLIQGRNSDMGKEKDWRACY